MFLNNDNHVYLAGPFFNEEQTKVVEDIKEILDYLKINYFSPKDVLKYAKTDPPEVATKCYKGNVRALCGCDLMIALIDDYDSGTMFEMGYFTALNKPVVAYSNHPDRRLNIMLSQSCVSFANNLSDLGEILQSMQNGTFESKLFLGEQE
jgi:nucleoside 2-deoxyribosyltransferase